LPAGMHRRTACVPRAGFQGTAAPAITTLTLHDALPISSGTGCSFHGGGGGDGDRSGPTLTLCGQGLLASAVELTGAGRELRVQGRIGDLVQTEIDQCRCEADQGDADPRWEKPPPQAAQQCSLLLGLPNQ